MSAPPDPSTLFPTIPADRRPDELSGSVERVTFHNPETGFAVLKVKVRGERELVTVVGCVTTVIPGEYLEACGRWTIDRDHGRQFRAERLRTTPPTTAEGIERYLASGSVRSIGPGFARKIVGCFGERTLDVIETYPETLRAIRGIGPKRVERIKASWQEQKGIRQIMLFLHAHGIGSGRAVRIYRTYGDQSVATIRTNPYKLADDIRGIGFRTADELAGKLGIDPASPHRARAAVRYVLQQLTSEGHVGYPEHGVLLQTTALVQIDRAIVEQAVAAEVAAENLVREEHDGQTWLFLTPLHRAEVGLARSVQRLSRAGGHPLPSIDVERAVAWVETRLGLPLAEKQREAIRQACRENVLVVTGGPGVGKTTLVRSLLEVFEAKGLRCVLTAPTGRAAKRLAETTGRKAKTVHRLLDFDPRTGGFQRDERNPLSGDLFVLDEASMVDVVLGQQFLRAVPTGACVVLVGDVDQLPSVGPGTVLADLIDSGRVPVVRLTEVFRQAERSRIVAAARQINKGRLPEIEEAADLTDFYFVEVDEPEAIQQMIVRLVGERIPHRFALDPRADIQVLTPMNRATLGARNLNQILQTALNPPRGLPEVQRYGWTFRAGDRVMQTENDYEKDVFNGDLGVISKIDPTEQEVTVTFEGRPVVYDFDDLDELSLSYAVTVHKSQGSEYPCVVIPVHSQHYMMLQRNLIYTGVTRGRKLVVLVGTRKALSMAVRRQDTSHRYTALRKRLTEF